MKPGHLIITLEVADIRQGLEIASLLSEWLRVPRDRDYDTLLLKALRDTKLAEITAARPEA